MKTAKLLGLISLGVLVSAPLYAVKKPAGTSLSVAVDRKSEPPAAGRRHVDTVRLKALSASAEQTTGRGELLSYLQNHPEVLGLDRTPDLRVDYVKRIPGTHGLSTRIYVNLIQVIQGVDMEGAHISFSYIPAPGDLRLDDVQVQVYPDVTTAETNLLDAASAQSRLQTRVKSSRVRPTQRKVRWLRNRWRTVQEFAVEDRGLRGAVDGSGQTYVWDDRLYVNYSGTVSGRDIEFDPLATGGNLSQVPLSQLQLTDGLGNTVYTNTTGGYSLTTPSSNNISVGLLGRWSNVNDSLGTDLSVQISAGSVNPVNLVFNPSGNVETNTAQVNAYRHTTLIHDWLTARGVQPAGIDVAINTNVNLNDICNAYYDYVSLNFFRSGGGCLNSAYDTVIYHEYGHFVDDKIGGVTSFGLSEGWGDVLATYITGQSVIAEGFYGTPSSNIRNAINNYSYLAFDESHNQGQAWAGFAWRLRTNLIAALGPTAGAALAENLVIPTLWANSLDIPAAVRAVAVRDDDDGNLSNGTPHWAHILAAATPHGLAFALDVTPPNPPATIQFSNLAPTQMQLSWSAATDNVAIAGYRIDVSSASNFNAILPAHNNRNVGNVLSTLVTGLSTNTTYYARVRAVDSAQNVSTNSGIAQGVTRSPDVLAPTVFLATPAPGATLSNLVTMSGSASDDVAVAYVKIQSDGVQIGTATGNSFWSYSLDTWTLSNGTHTLSARAEDQAGNHTTASVAVTLSNMGSATYDPALRAPRCTGTLNQCNSGTLLNGRGTMAGGIEPNQPNTLAGSLCTDGASGTYHSDESLDQLRISTLDGTPLAPGKVVRIDATVWAYLLGFSADYLDLFHTADATSPAWTPIATLQPAMAGAQVLSSTYTLPNGGPNQAIRGTFRYSGVPAICTVGGYDDRDDLIFQVIGSTPTPPDTIAPAAPLNVYFSTPSVSSLSLFWNAATDNVGVAGYRIDVSTEANFNSFINTYNNRNVFNFTYEIISFLPPSTTFYARVRAYDAAQNVSTHSAVATAVTLPAPPPTITISLPAGSQNVFGMLEVSATWNSLYLPTRVDYFIDGQFKVTASSYPYTGYLDTTSVANGSHTLSAIIYDMLGGSGTSNTINLNVSNLTVFQDNFTQGLNAWTIRDEGTIFAPSAWAVTGSTLIQTSAIYGNDPTSSLAKPGTQILTGNLVWTDYSFTYRFKASNGSIGVIFRHKDNNNYYRWSLDPDGYQRIVQKLGGTFYLGDQQPYPYLPGTWYTVTVDVKGYRLRVYLNGKLVIQMNNSSHANGGIGLYTWQTTDSSFSQVKVLSSLTFDTPPTPPTNVAFTSLSPTSLQLTWTASTDDIGISGYQAELSSQTPFHTYHILPVLPSTGMVIPGLNPGTTYYARMRAIDTALHFSSYSAIAQGLTLPPPDTTPPTAPANVSFSSVTSTSLWLTWTGSTDTVGVAGYRLDVSTRSNFSGTLPDYSNLDVGNADARLVSGLNGNTTYYARVRAYDAAQNVSSNSTVTQAVTLFSDITSPTPPASVSLSSATPTSLRVSWTPSTDNIGVTSYVVSLTPDPTFTSYSNTIVGNITSHVIAGLTPNTTYYVRVRARDAALNISAFSATAIYRTLPLPDTMPPTPPASVTFSSATTTSLQLSWAPSTDNVGVTNYIVSLAIDPTFTGGASWIVGNQTTLPFAGLTPNTTYYARVRARDAALNVSSFSATAMIRTLSIPDTSSPTLSITSPAAGAVVSGTTLITGTAADNQGVTQVHVVVDGAVVGLATGTTSWSYLLNTQPIANGAHTLTIVAVDAAINYTLMNRALSVLNPSGVAYDPVLKAPRCAGVSSSCDSGPALLNGRANIPNGSEPNQPNTLGGTCVDGAAGSYHTSESIDRIRVFTLDNSPMAPGKAVRLEVTVWASSAYTSNFLDLYYTLNANSPSWILLGTLVPSGPGARTLAGNITLPNGAPLQALRANFRYLGTQNACTSGSTNDHDDLVFQLNGTSMASGVSGADFGGVLLLESSGDTGTPSTIPPEDPRASVNLLSDNLRVYPNPWRADRNSSTHPTVTFDQLTAGSTVKIFTVSGHWVQTLSESAGRVDWDRKNSSGDTAASGIYLYLITDPQGNKAKGQLVLIQ